MLPAAINNAVVAFRDKDGKVFLSWEYGVPMESVTGYMPGQLYRVVDYNERYGILYLKPEGNAKSEDYNVTFDKYGSLFTAMGVKRIEVNRPYKQITLATGYSQPIKTRYRDQAATPPPPPPSPPRRPEPPIIPQQPDRFTESFTFDIRDALFEDGIIKFIVKVKSRFQNMEVTITNPNIKKYFDAVKNYIYKIFGSRKTSCSVTFEVRDRKCVPIAVNDCVLSSLDETILQQIHDGWVEKVVLSAERDDIVSIDDLIHQVRDETLNPETVFNHIVQEQKTSHYHHLRYLSARQAIDQQKLSVTGKPLSFVFVIREKGVLYLIWETYLTKEATYVWKLPDASQILHRYGLILEMRKVGRMVYRNKKEPGFFYIEHQYKLPQSGFLKWKEEFEEIIGKR